MEGFFTKSEGHSSTIGASCVSCGLSTDCRTPMMKVEGHGTNGILVILPFPYNVEDRRGKIFSGEGAEYLKEELRRIGIELQHCRYMYAVSCHSTEPKEIAGAVTHCRRFVDAEIKRYKPKLIIAAGLESLQVTIPHSYGKSLGAFDRWLGRVLPIVDYNAHLAILPDPNSVMSANKRVLFTLFRNYILKIAEFIGNPTEIIQINTWKSKVLIFEDLQSITEILDEIYQDWDTFAFDLETTGIKPHNIQAHNIGLISFSNGEISYCFRWYNEMPFLKRVGRLMRSKRHAKIAHNMKYENMWMSVWFGVEPINWQWDTMLAEHVLDNRRETKGLKFQSFVRLGITDYNSHIEQYLITPNNTSANETNRLMEGLSDSFTFADLALYCGLDSLFTFHISVQQKASIAVIEGLQEAYQLLHDGALALSRAEQAGLRIDMKYVHDMTSQLTNEIEGLSTQFTQSKIGRQWSHIYGQKTNYDSDLQLRVILKKQGFAGSKETTGGAMAVDEEQLRASGIPEMMTIIDIKKKKKLRDTYLKNLISEPVDGVIHPFFNLHTVTTYRSSSDRPNFQNFPKRDKESMKIIRSAIYPREGNQLLEVDFGKLEVSIAACYHEDPTMLKYLTSDHNDMHGDLAQQIFKIPDKIWNRKESAFSTMRGAAKNAFIFPQFYGDYYKNNAEGLRQWVDLPAGVYKTGQGLKLPNGMNISDWLIKNGIKSHTDFENHLRAIEDDFWNNRFKVYGRWKKIWIKEYENKGFFQMKTGFRVTGEIGNNQIINFPVQGAAFHCLLYTFVQMDRWLRDNEMQTKLVGQIHDALVFDVVPEELQSVAREVKRIATVQLPNDWEWIIIPLSVEAELCPIDGSWAEKKDFELPEI